MKLPPVIVVQIIHISGPLKGEIQEFTEGKITIGRHPSCHVKFPPEFTSISRNHAEIVREGNQFRLIDRSANGTFVNGKKVQEIYLKEGDVLMFAEGGPKVSFLTQMKEGQVVTETPPPPLKREYKEESKIPLKEPVIHEIPQKPEIIHKEVFQPEIVTPPAAVSTQKVKVSLIIQYGPTIRSFKEVPVTIGKHPVCEMFLDHPAIYDRHTQIFFSQNQYWIKDLTGKGLVQINRSAIGLQSPIKPDDEISLSPQGPIFRFLGDGRLAEVEEPPVEKPSVSHEKEKKVTRRNIPEEKTSKDLLSQTSCEAAGFHTLCSLFSSILILLPVVSVLSLL